MKFLRNKTCAIHMGFTPFGEKTLGCAHNVLLKESPWEGHTLSACGLDAQSLVIGGFAGAGKSGEGEVCELLC